MSDSSGYGITQQGFVVPKMSDLVIDLQTAMQNQFGAGINTNPEAFFGQIIGIMAERLSLVWDAMQDVYSSQTPDTAFGASLDNVGALRGIPRLQATYSVILNVNLFGAAGTLVPATTTQFYPENSPTSLFATNSSVVLVAGQNCIQTITFSSLPVSGNWNLSIWGSTTPSLPFNITAAALQSAIQALTFCSGCTVTGSVSSGFTVTFNGAGTGGLMVQPIFTSPESTLVNSSSSAVIAIPAITQAGIDQGVVNVTATQTGPVIANAGTLIEISTPISGLTSVLNTTDAVLGSNVETDTAYRTRMAEELQIAGAGTVEAIKSKLLTVAGVTSVLVYENISDVTDSNGRPPHSFEAVVNGGTDAAVAEEIWVTKAAGIATYGTSNYTITDSMGNTHVIYFSRPTAVPIYIIANLTVNSNYPSTGNALVQEVLANYINALGQGVSIVVIPLLISQLATIPGIDDAQLLIGTSPDPTSSANIPIVAYQVATAQTIDITVNTVSG